MTVESSKLPKLFQISLLKTLCVNTQFHGQYAPDILPEYIDGKIGRTLLTIIKEYFAKYNRELNLTRLIEEIDALSDRRGLDSALVDLLVAEANLIFETEEGPEDYIIENLMAFCRKQAMKNAIRESVQLLKDNDSDYGAIGKLVDNALTVGAGTDIGYFFEDLYEVQDLYRDKYRPEDLIKTGFHTLDQSLKGGMAPGEVHVCIAPPKCFVGNTLISLLDGRELEIEKIVEEFKTNKDLWVFSSSTDGTPVPRRITAAFQSGSVVEYCRVTLDNGAVFECTPEHQQMCRDGSWIETKNLQPGDSLMPLYRRERYYSGGIRSQIFNNKNGKYQPLHRWAAQVLNRPLGTTDLHHKDRNKANNNPSNLVWLTSKEHGLQHAEEARVRMNSQWAIEDSALRINHSIEISERNRRNWAEEPEKWKEIAAKNFSKITSEQRIANSKLGNAVFRANPENLVKLYEREWTDEQRADQAVRSSKVLNNLWQDPEFCERQRIRSSKRMTENNPGTNPEMQKARVAKMQAKGDFEKISQLQKDKFKDPEYVRNLKYKNCLRVINSLQEQNKDITESNYEAERTSNRQKYLGCGRWEVYEASKPKEYNHKVISVEIVRLEKPIPVYDLTVPGYNNFALSAGTFTHNCGKSTFLTSVTAYNIMVKKTVFHISLEISAVEVLAKIAARITGMNLDDIFENGSPEYTKKMEKYKKRSPNLFVNHWTESTADCLTIRSWISRIRAAKGVKPDLIVIDYDDALNPIKKSNKASGDMYGDGGEVYNDLKALSTYFSCPILTAAQPNRAAWHKFDRDNAMIDSGDLAHSAKKAMKTTSMFSLNFKKDDDYGWLYIDIVRRGIGNRRVPLVRKLERATFIEGHDGHKTEDEG